MKTPLASALLFLAIAGPLAAAELELASPFQEHMVLQRGMPVPVWGWGKPGAGVAVSVAGKTAKAKVETDSRWRVDLPALEAGGPHPFEVRSGDDAIRFTDVLVGEVWICSGQSNMQMGRQAMIGVGPLLEQAAKRPIRNLTVRQTVRFEPQERCGGTWAAAPPASAVAFAFAFHLQASLDVPVGVIVTAWGSSSLEGWMPLDLTERLPHFKAAMERFEREDRARVTALLAEEKAGKRWARKDNIYLRTRPNILYNAMLHPLAPCAVRGLVWYQGESNTGSLASMKQYGISLPMWCARLRRLWNRDDFHLLAVMLPRFGRAHKSGPTQEPDRPDAHSWAWFRESQSRLRELPHTGVANTIDLGDLKDIHPKDKEPIGRRLALLAQRDVNGMKVEAEGPTLEKAVVEGKAIRVSLRHAAGLKTVDGRPPRAFWIAGEDRAWRRAEARIAGESVVLRSADVPAPKVVRYAFAAFPDVNLVNGAGLPAFPFRTDRDDK